MVKRRRGGAGISRGPKLVDVHVGSRLRLRRVLMKLSQSELGEMLGVTFQQVQKYEKGQNRISASRMFQMGEILGVPVEFFFEGFNEDTPDKAYGFSETKQEDFSWLEDDGGDLMERKETLHLVRTYYQVRDSKVRKHFLKVIQAMVASQEHS